MSQVRKLNRRRKYGNVEARIQKIKDTFHIEAPIVAKKPSSIFTYIPPKYPDDDSKGIN